MCPDLKCQSGVCKECADKMMKHDMVLIKPPEREEINDGDILGIDKCDNDTESSGSNDGSGIECDYIIEDIDLISTQDEDDIGDFVVLGEEDDIPREDIFPEYFPMTVAGDEPFQIDAEICVNKHVNGHVIMNQCGSLLNRNDRDIIGHQSQKYFA